MYPKRFGVRSLSRATGILSLLILLISARIPLQRTLAQASPDQVGEWSEVLTWPFVAIHMHVLPDGNVLAYPRDGGSEAHIWDPATNSLTPAPNTGTNLFCSGHSFLADGRLLVTGGHIRDGWGLKHTNIFDPSTRTWTRVDDMNNGRWYPTNTTLANGEVLVISGSTRRYQNNDVPQVWQTSGGWRDLTDARLALPLYPFMHLAPNGKVFNSGPNQTTRYLDTSGTGQWTTVALQKFNFRDYGSSVLYDDGKVLTVGGHDPPTATAEVIDLNEPSPSWRYVGSMTYPRRQHTATLLPDGTVLVTGGTSSPGFNDATGAVFSAELWDPVTETWSTLSSMTERRLYHSTAVLLVDGRVLVAGGGQPWADGEAADHRTAEIYSPPYLFKGSRPTFSSAPLAVDYGETFSVATPDAAVITGVNWIRLSSVTHAYNQNQRINRLIFSPAPGGLDITAPSDSNLCPPGHYILFIIDGAGVPSAGTVIRIGAGVTSPPPTAPSDLVATALSSRQIDLEWTDNASTEDGFRIELSADGSNFSEIATTGKDVTRFSSTGLTAATTYDFRVRAFNEADFSHYSNTASATTLTSGGLGTGLQGDYFDNRDLTNLVLTRIDARVDFNWGAGSPDPSIGDESFSVRWTGLVEPLYTETYTFHTITDDGVRLWVDGVLVIDRWIDQAATEWTGTVALTALQGHELTMEYYDKRSLASVQLLWSSARQTKIVIPQSQLYPPPAGTGPAAPSDLTATPVSKSQIDLVWTDNSNEEDGFKIESSSKGSAWSVIATVGPDVTTFQHSGLKRNTTYSYRVRAFDAEGSSAYSNMASAKTLRN